MRYKGTFNYHGQNIILWGHAKDRHGAFRQFISRLVPIIGINRINLYNYFKSPEKDNYIIEEKPN